MEALASVRPQDRNIKGSLIFTRKNDGVSESYPKAYSIPMDRCVGCAVYKVDDSTTPTGYYCQSEFVSSFVFEEHVKNKRVPDNCKMWATEYARKLVNHL